MNIRSILFVLAGTTLAAAGFAQAASPMHDKAMATQDSSPSAPQLQAAMRSLWHGHVVHTREYAMAVHAHDSAKAKSAADAVVANAKQIADAVASMARPPVRRHCNCWPATGAA